jgi:maltose O-acetyltransferase
MRFRYELILWYSGFLKLIPGQIGCEIRNLFLPYKHGKNVKVWDFVHIDSPSKLKIGNNVSINRGSVINASGGVCIGNDTLIGPNVTIYSQNHNFNNSNVLIREQGFSLAKVEIGNNVWLASNVTVLPGVTIGENIIVAANSLVNKSISKQGVYAGTPVKLIKQI